MPTHYLATSRAPRNPVRVQRWDCSIRAGDDFKLALTVYQDNTGTLANVVNSQSRLVLRVERERTGYEWGWGGGGCSSDGWDYGLGYITLDGQATITTNGYVVGGMSGRLNFLIPSATTACMHRGRYRLSVQVDLSDGEFSQVEGILQVREGAFTYDIVNPLPVTLQPSGWDYGSWDGSLVFDQATLPVDADGFVQLYAGAVIPPTGYGVLGQLVLGSTALGQAAAPVGFGSLGQLVLGAT